MSAYNDMTESIACLKHGLDSRVKSLCVKETNGIEYGYPVFGYAGNESDVYLYHNNVGAMAFDADFVASNSIVLTVNGTATTNATRDDGT